MIEQVLEQIVREHPEAVKDERSCRALLEDLVPGEPARRMALWLAQVSGIVTQIGEMKAGKSVGGKLGKLAQVLESRSGLKPELALWSVTVWARALGVDTGTSAKKGSRVKAGAVEAVDTGAAELEYSKENPFVSEELPATREERNLLYFEQVVGECLTGTGMNEFRKDRLEDLRERLGLTQEQAAQAFERVKQSQETQEVADATTWTELTVCPYGEADCPTVAQALQRVHDLELGPTRIWVRPGTYRSSVLLDGQIELLAEGAREQVLLLVENDTALRVLARRARVSGFTIVNKGADLPAVSVDTGRLVVEDCALTSRMGTGVLVTGVQARPVFRQVLFTQCARSGVRVEDQARPRFMECQFLRNQASGMKVETEGDPRLEHCIFRENQPVGAFVAEHGLGEFVRCEFERQRLHGVQTQSGGAPLVRHCEFRNNGDGGFYACAGGQGVAEQCTFSGNGALGAVACFDDGSGRVTVL